MKTRRNRRRVVACGERGRLIDQLAQPGHENHLEQRFFGREVPEQRADADAGLTRNHPIEFLKAHVNAVHETTDPEVMGLVVSSRDYHNHWAMAEALR